MVQILVHRKDWPNMFAFAHLYIIYKNDRKQHETLLTQLRSINKSQEVASGLYALKTMSVVNQTVPAPLQNKRDEHT
jgi:hypothetical protein